MKLDQTDKKIIQLLGADARMSNNQMAKVIGVTEGTVRNRIQKLIKNRVIKISVINNINRMENPSLAFVGLDVETRAKDAVAKALSKIPLVKKVIHVEATYYENFVAENFAPVIVKLADNYSHIVCSANTFGKNLMPRIAAALDTSQISDIIKVISSDTFLRPIYAGNAFATVKS